LQPDVSVDIEGLRKTGVRIKTPMVAVDQAVNQELAHLTVGAGAGSWDSVPALGEAAARWSDYLRDLALRIRKTGEDLLTSADEFEAADQAAAHSFNIPVPRQPAPSYNFPVR
jgi:hypothetical protein